MPGARAGTWTTTPGSLGMALRSAAPVGRWQERGSPESPVECRRHSPRRGKPPGAGPLAPRDWGGGPEERERLLGDGGPCLSGVGAARPPHCSLCRQKAGSRGSGNGEVHLAEQKGRQQDGRRVRRSSWQSAVRAAAVAWTLPPSHGGPVRGEHSAPPPPRPPPRRRLSCAVRCFPFASCPPPSPPPSPILESLSK